MITINFIAARALSVMILGVFGVFYASTALARNTLPPEVIAALAQAGVPSNAVSMVVMAIPKKNLVSQTTPEEHIPGADSLASEHSLWGARLSHQADVQRNPASVMKLITTYAALNTLGPDFTWKNRVYVDGSLGGPAKNGVLEGNLVIRGSGDPKLVLERIQDLFAAVQAKGVREVRGDIILDRSVFKVPDKNPADFDDEPLRPYNAVPDGLLVNFKSLIFTFVPDPANNRVLVKSEPPISQVKIPTEVPLTNGNCTDWKNNLRADFFTPNAITFQGGYAASCGERSWSVAYSEPRGYASRVIDAMWREAGGTLTGQVREGSVPSQARLLLTAPSLPLSAIIADVNKFSNNVMAQQVFLTLSAQGRAGNFESSKKLASAWWKKNLPGHKAPVIENGSGLSRLERTNASALTALLQLAAASKHAQVFSQSLSIAGVDGTVVGMKTRNAHSIALGNAQLKTGTINGVTAIAGYATGISGQRYSVVGIINHPQASAARVALDKLLEWTVRDAEKNQ